jgi:hypothetical protein
MREGPSPMRRLNCPFVVVGDGYGNGIQVSEGQGIQTDSDVQAARSNSRENCPNQTYQQSAL